MDIQKVAEKLRERGYQASCFDSKESARHCLAQALRGKSIGFGDSETLRLMELRAALSRENTVIDPTVAVDIKEFVELGKQALTTDIFFSSVNAITEDGIIVNIDGTGNRVAGSLFGHQKVYYIIGRNKIAADLDAALLRARQVAAPLNCRRKGKKTPCAIRGDKCYDCHSAERICNAVLIELRKMQNMEMEVMLIDEELGF